MAEHELNKIVDDDGEVFNLRDSTKQPVADRVTAWGSTPSDTKYPSEKLVKTALDDKLDWLNGYYDRNANSGSGWAKIASMSKTWNSTNLTGLWDVMYLSTTDTRMSTLELNIRFDSTNGAKVNRLVHRVAADYSTLINFAVYVNGTNGEATTVELWAKLSNNWHGVAIREVGGSYYLMNDRKQWTYYKTTGGGTDKPTADAEHNIQVVDATTSIISLSTHTHGNITSAGALQTTDVAIASGDKLVITDSSNSNKVARSSTSFDGTTTTTALTPKGTFEAFAKAADITTAIQALDVGSVGGAGKYISAISEADGKISATATDMDTTPTASSTNAVTSGGVKTALDAKVNVASILLENQSTTLLSIVQSYAGTENKHYARWYTKSDGGTKLTDLPVSGKCFVCEAICSRWVSASDYVYQLTLWSKEDTNPYVAIVKQSTTAISWSRLNTQTITGVKGDAESSYRTGNVNLTPANLGISATSTSVTVGSTTFNQYVHPTTSGNKHVPSGGSSGQFLGWSADGTATWVNNPNTDTKVKATAKTDNVEYKILATASASPTSGNATEAVYDVDITLNPSTNTIAANISGNAATATKPKTTTLTTSNNLDDFYGGSTHGNVFYYTWASGNAPAGAASITGTGTAPTATMEVIKTHSGSYAIQIVYTAANGTWFRIYNNGTWGSWYSYAKSDHVHGHINNNGTITSNGVDLASGDRLAIVDSSDSSLVKKTNISFDGSTTTQALTKAGTWATFNNYSHPAGSAASKTGVPTADATPGFGGTFKVNQITTDSTSHVSAVTERTITIPNATATTSAAGLMSAADKTKLDNAEDNTSYSSSTNCYGLLLTELTVSTNVDTAEYVGTVYVDANFGIQNQAKELIDIKFVFRNNSNSGSYSVWHAVAEHRMSHLNSAGPVRIAYKTDANKAYIYLLWNAAGSATSGNYKLRLKTFSKMGCATITYPWTQLSAQLTGFTLFTSNYMVKSALRTDVGSSTIPVYVDSSGEIQACTTYAGGTAVTLNNSSKAGSTASFYAPTAGGTANYVLIGNGTTSAPTWAEKAPKASVADYPAGFSSRLTSWTWGTLTTANGYTQISSWKTSNGSQFAFAEKNEGGSDQAVSVQIDGVFYQREGQKRVLDVSDVTNSAPTLAWNTTSTIGTVGGTALTVKLPASPNTDTKQNITLATTTKAFITGVSTTPTSTAQALTGLADTGVYLTTTAGELNATQYKVNEHCTMKYNSTKSSLDFTFS